MSDTRRLILHCGQSKAGSSAIQAHLRDSPPGGLVYPATGQWPDGAHHILAFALDGRTRRGNIEIPSWDTLAAKLGAELDAANGTVVISCEMLDPDKLVTLLERVLPDLRRPFDHIEIVLCLRHPLERAASTYNQRVKDAAISERRMPDDFLSQSGALFRLAPEVARWAALPYPVTYLDYHPAETLLPRFLTALGFDHTVFDRARPRRNRSISGFALVALLAAHRMNLGPDARATLFDRLRADRENKIWSSPSFPFSAWAAQRFIDEVVADDARRVKARLGFEISQIHRAPPGRFEIDEAQRRALMESFASFRLDAHQVAELNAVLDTFRSQPEGRDPTDQR